MMWLWCVMLKFLYSMLLGKMLVFISFFIVLLYFFMLCLMFVLLLFCRYRLSGVIWCLMYRCLIISLLFLYLSSDGIFFLSLCMSV